jgi:hypothetical protein
MIALVSLVEQNKSLFNVDSSCCDFRCHYYDAWIKLWNILYTM